MTEPSQYFKGRTVQEQMNEVIGYVDVRSAEVATTAIVADVAQVHQDKLDADADAQAAAASAAAAAGTLANAVKKTGEASQSIAGDIAISGDLDVGGDADITGALDVTGAITGNDASLIGTVTVPTEATGTFTMKSANSTKVKNELDNYAPMVRTTGNQTVGGVKTFSGLQTSKKVTFDPSTRPGSYQGLYPAILTDANDADLIRYRIDRGTASTGLGWQLYFSNNQSTKKSVILFVTVNHSNGDCKLNFQDSTNTVHTLASWTDASLKDV